MSSGNITAEGTSNHMVNLLLYFAHMNEIVSKSSQLLLKQTACRLAASDLHRLGLRLHTDWLKIMDSLTDSFFRFSLLHVTIMFMYYTRV